MLRARPGHPCPSQQVIQPGPHVLLWPRARGALSSLVMGTAAISAPARRAAGEGGMHRKGWDFSLFLAPQECRFAGDNSEDFSGDSGVPVL